MAEDSAGVASPAAPKGASELVFSEIERVVNEQLDNFQNLTSRAGTVLSVLLGAIAATLTIAGVVAHPPLWAVAATSIPLLLAVITSCMVFVGVEVSTGPAPESLIPFVGESEEDLRAALISFYSDVVEGSTDEQGRHVPGNRELLRRKARLFEVSVLLLAITIATLVVVALVLYAR